MNEEQQKDYTFEIIELYPIPEIGNWNNPAWDKWYDHTIEFIREIRRKGYKLKIYSVQEVYPRFYKIMGKFDPITQEEVTWDRKEFLQEVIQLSHIQEEPKEEIVSFPQFLTWKSVLRICFPVVK